jgi:hypothetical protein
MTGKFRGIHTLDLRNTIGKITVMGHPEPIFKHIRAFGQVIEKEIEKVTGKNYYRCFFYPGLPPAPFFLFF